MARFGVGVMHNTINSRFGPKPLVDADYAIGLVRRAVVRTLRKLRGDAMPMIDLTFVRGSLNDQALGLLTDELVTALLRAERAPDTPFLRDNTLVYLHALDPAAQSVGGCGAGLPRFRVEMTVFAGALSQDRKERLAADVHAAVCAAAGIEPEGERALHVWTLIHEIPEGNWAGGGKVIYYRQVKGLVADDAE
jgi:phenylpyruvate tautomerase PptA (4-oxalocrotonate tautomerase family)